MNRIKPVFELIQVDNQRNYTKTDLMDTEQSKCITSDTKVYKLY